VRRNLLVQRLPKERVAEAIHNRGADDGPLFDDGRGRCLVERGFELDFETRKHVAQDVQLELAPDNRRHAEDSIRAVAQARQSLANRVAQPFRDATRRL
jgi:hypothetical protein